MSTPHSPERTYDVFGAVSNTHTPGMGAEGTEKTGTACPPGSRTTGGSVGPPGKGLRNVQFESASESTITGATTPRAEMDPDTRKAPRARRVVNEAGDPT